MLSGPTIQKNSVPVKAQLAVGGSRRLFVCFVIKTRADEREEKEDQQQQHLHLQQFKMNQCVRTIAHPDKIGVNSVDGSRA